MNDSVDFNYDYWKDELLALMPPNAIMHRARARWKLVQELWKDGKTPEEIGEFIGKSASTAIQLLKRAFKEDMKQPEVKWPMDKEGYRLCDIPHPYNIKTRVRTNFIDNRGFPWAWVHVRSKACADGARYCPVCKQKYTPPKTLVEVFAQK